MDSLQDDAPGAEALGVLSRFRAGLYQCLTARRDELFELADAVLCADGPVKTLVGCTNTGSRSFPSRSANRANGSSSRDCGKSAPTSARPRTNTS